METIKKTKQLKHQVICGAISQQIHSGKLLPGQRIPTEHELAKTFSTSRPTVGKALRELQNQGLIYRRQGAGSFVAPMVETRTRKVGALLGFSEYGANHGIFGNLLAELSNACTKSNYSVVMTNYPVGKEDHIVIQHAQKTCTDLVRQKVEGVFFMPLDLAPDNEHVNQDIVDTLENAGAVVIVLDRDIVRPPKRSKFDRVGINNTIAAQMLTDHLLDLGCRRINLVTHGATPAPVQERIDGYIKALTEHGLSPSPDQIHHLDPRDTERELAIADHSAIDALVCINDGLAALVMRSCQSQGLRIPEDIKIVGFDDSPIAPFLSVPLTTVRQPVKYIAQEAFRAMLSRLDDPDMPARDILITAELIVRESCGAKLQK